MFTCDPWGNALEVLYLSGPMTGYEDLNKPAFDAEATRLRALGYVVISPLEMDQVNDPDYGEKYWNVLKRDVIGMISADALVLLPGAISSNSNGVLVETLIASQLNIPIIESILINTPPINTPPITNNENYEQATTECHEENEENAKCFRENQV